MKDLLEKQEREYFEKFPNIDWEFVLSQKIEMLEKVVEMIKGFRPISFTTNGQVGVTEEEVLYQTQKLADNILSTLQESIKGITH